MENRRRPCRGHERWRNRVVAPVTSHVEIVLLVVLGRHLVSSIISLYYELNVYHAEIGS